MLSRASWPLRCLAWLAGSVVLALAPSFPAAAADKVVLMLNWYVYGEHAPFYYGLEKGLYSAEGIDLEIQEGRGSGVTTQAVAAKSATFGYVDIPTMMRVAVKGAPVLAIGVLLQKCPMSVMSFPERGIRAPEDLRGRILAMTPGGSNEQIWPLFLKKTGLRDTDYRTVSGDPQTKVNAVIGGQADALLGYPMDQGMKILDATGKRVQVIRYADYGIDLVSSGIIAHNSLLQDNPGLARRFMAASSRAVEGAVRDRAGAVDAILKALPKAGKRETLREGFEQTIQFYAGEGRSAQPFRVPDQAIVDTIGTMVDYGGLDPAARRDPKILYSAGYLPQ